MIRIGVMAWSLIAVLVLGYVATLQINGHLNVDSNILRLLPATERDPAINRAFDNFSEISMERLVFLIENSDLDQAKRDADSLASMLQSSPWIEELTLKVSPQQQQEIAQFNYRFRNHLLTRTDARLLEAGEYDQIVDDAIERLYSPLTNFLTELLATDPFQLSYRFGIAAASDDSQAVSMDDGYLVGSRNDKRYVLVTARLSQSPFDQTLQQEVIARIAEVEARFAQSSVPSQLIRTGALFYTADAYATASREISLFGGASLLLVLGLMLLSFRRLSPILLVAVVLIFGIGAGFAMVRLVFGEVHLLTFIFGASLIGVAVDYAFHYFAVDSAVEPGKSAGNRIGAIFPAITLGLISSIIGYTALLATPFPGLQQMALFCIVGLVGSYATVVLLFPAISINTRGSSPLLSFCKRFLAIGATRAARTFWIFLLVLPVVAIVLVTRSELPRDDIREFQARNPVLEQQEATVQSVLDSSAANQFYLVKADSAQDLLKTIEQAADKLDVMVSDKLIGGYVSVSPWLESIERQQENFRLYEALYSSAAAQSLVSGQIVTPEEFDAARGALARDKDNYLLPDEWLDSTLGQQFSYLWIGAIESDWFAVIALRGIDEAATLDDLGDRVVYVDQVSTISDLLYSYRESAVVLLLVAITLIFVMLCLRYGIARASILLSSPLIALSGTIIGLALMGESLNLFNVLALFLVIGVGIDFGIFFAETQRPDPHTLLAVLLSALTTTFSFGMLSLSSTSVIQSFGLTMLIGISTVFLLAPVIGNLVTPRKSLHYE